MPRLVNGERKITNPKPENAGKLLIFCEGTIGKILGSNGNEKIRAAIDNAKLLEKYWKESGKDMDNDIVQMNPAVEIYKLIERLLDEIVYLCVGKC